MQVLCFLESLKSDFLSLWGSIAEESIIVPDVLQSISARAALTNIKDENAIAPQLIFILFSKSNWVFQNKEHSTLMIIYEL